MPRKSAVRNESPAGPEQSDWYATPDGRRQTQREFERALKSGTMIRSAGASIPGTDRKVLEALLRQAKENATRLVSIRVPVADIERAKSIASKRGIDYQTVLKQAMRRGLKRAV